MSSSPAPSSKAKQGVKAQEEVLLQRPLYAFDLPPELLATLVIKGDQPAGQEQPDTQDNGTRQRVELEQGSIASGGDSGDKTGMSCALCGIRSNTVAEQRQHVRSDLHKFNIKRKVRAQPPVSEAEFEKQLEELSESISGSEGSVSEDEHDAKDGGGGQQPSDQLAAMLRKKAALSSIQQQDEEDDFPSGTKPQRGPLIWFESPLLSEHTSVGVYRALFKNLEQDSEALGSLKTRQIAPTPAAGSSSAPNSSVASQAPPAPHVFMCMIGGGHFAAMVVSLAPKLMKRNGVMERDAVVLAHKTFHRYTTRRKQGGAQSANDAAKGAAHSAGSSLRRYNEAALTNEIRELLGQWRQMLDTADLIFVRATGANNRKTLFNYEDSPLNSKDKRIRGFPFSTRRATQKELMRCFVELTRLKVSRVDESSLAALNEAASSSKAQVSSKAAPAAASKPKPSKEEEQLVSHTTALTALVRRSKGPAVVTYLASNKLPADFRLYPANHHTPTLLHLAASTVQPNVVLSLLTKPSPPSDPTIANSEGKTAFELSGDRVTRDTFRLARTELGEGKWDWSAAKVPSGITKAQYDKNIEKDKKASEETRKGEQERREAELQRLKKATDPSDSGKNRRLGSSMAAPSVRETETRGLSEDAVRKLERERRARAAEARMKALSGGQ